MESVETLRGKQRFADMLLLLGVVCSLGCPFAKKVIRRIFTLPKMSQEDSLGITLHIGYRMQRTWSLKIALPGMLRAAGFHPFCRQTQTRASNSWEGREEAT